MLFHTFEFLIFFTLLLLLLLLIKPFQQRKILLLIASYVFYMFWNPAFILLILFSTIVDYLVGNKLAITEDQNKRKILLWVSLIANLGMLGFFKYANFFVNSSLTFLSLFGIHPSWTDLNIILPVGISFYTFQTLSYTIDLYYKKIPPCRSAFDFALFVSFFPQLVAGPIVRAADFLPQLNAPRRLNLDKLALFMILRGMIKKVLVADNIAIFADRIFEAPSDYPSIIIWLATLCFYVQIYCDFSGYSDIAIGIARILGFKLPLNFNYPYFSRTPSEFWKRWHISLSSWLRDYLYIPLGGNRKGTFHTHLNLMLTMLLGGLWHGANWNFVFWGFLHGIALIVHRLWTKYFNISDNIKKHFIYQFFSWLLMQYWVLLTWIPFRLINTEKMFITVKKFVFFDFNFSLFNLGLGNAGMFSTALILLIFLFIHTISRFTGSLDFKLSRASNLIGILIFALSGVFFTWFWPLNEVPFIYFQF